MYNGIPTVGYHYFQALEISAASGTTTWYGDDGTTYVLNGITLTGWF
jgi:hypothetical protein